MKSKQVKIICFSPTKSTRKILENIASGISNQIADILDLTRPSAALTTNREIFTELALIGVPVYGGRVPVDAEKRLQKLKADGIPAVIVVVYGNRGYGDALLELNDIAIKCGFKPIAAGAFIAEHSFSIDEYPIAKSRPDADDLNKAKAFGAEIGKLMNNDNVSTQSSTIKLPGNFPYKERSKSAGFSPETDKSICINCKKCVDVCPTGAISANDVTITDPDKCILCKACVKVCENGARIAKHPAFLDFAKHLCTNCQLRLEPDTFI